MYGKLFASMYDGSLYGNWKALVTFQQLVILANRDGVVDMTPHALAARTGIPLDIVQAGIEALESPDPFSRTPDNEGRRIERLDDHRPWGWVITNYAKYRDMVRAEEKRAADRDRLAAKRATARDKPRHVADSGQMSLSVANVAQVEVEVEVDAKKTMATSSPGREQVLLDRFQSFWALYPRKVKKPSAQKAFLRLRPTQAELERITAGVQRWLTTSQWRKDRGQFIPHPATFLNDRMWEDEACGGYVIAHGNFTEECPGGRL
jgi:hypothetical protein